MWNKTTTTTSKQMLVNFKAKKQMERDKEEFKQLKHVLHVLNKAIQKGPWDKTVFLRATGKKLCELRDRFKAGLNLTPEEEAALESGTTAESLEIPTISQPQANQIQVYISLYNAAGNEIMNWERLLNSLGNSLITRPILKTEDDVRELIRSKVNKKNEAYVVAYIEDKDIIKPEGNDVPKDALGHELMMLKSGSIQLENIVRFVHTSGEYSFQKGRLVRVGDVII